MLHYDKMETAVAPPPLRSLFASAWLAVWSEVKLKTDQRKMPQRGNMRALPARRDSQNYYPKKKNKNGQKGQPVGECGKRVKTHAG